MCMRFEMGSPVEPNRDIEFKRHPVFMTEFEMKELERRIRTNSTARHVLDSPWFKLPAAVAISFTLMQMTKLAFPQAGFGPFMLLDAAVAIPTTFAGLKGFDYLSSFFRRQVGSLGSDFEREIRRRHAWRVFQHELTHRVHDNIDETRAALAARAAGKNGTYTIPMIEEMKHLLPGLDKAAVSLDNVLPTTQVPKSFTRESWKTYSRNVRVKKAALHSMARRAPRQMSGRTGPDMPGIPDFIRGLMRHIEMNIG